MSIFRVGNRSIVIPSEKDNKLNDANKLVYAAYKGKVRVVKDLLAKGVESVVEDGAALKLAALKGNTTIVKLLLAVPEDPMKLLKHKHHSMDTIFISIVNAIYSGNLDTVKAIFPYKMGLRIILRDMGKPAREYLDEALQVAASIGNSDALEFLLTSTRFSKKSITNALCVCTAKGNVYGVETTLKYQPMLRVEEVRDAVYTAMKNGWKLIVNKLKKLGVTPEEKIMCGGKLRSKEETIKYKKYIHEKYGNTKLARKYLAN